MAFYAYNKQVNANKLYREIYLSSLRTAMVNIISAPGVVTIETLAILSQADHDALDSLITAHTTDDVFAETISEVSCHVAFGLELIDDLSATNSQSGYTSIEVKAILDKLGLVIKAWQTGSLLVAIDQLALVIPDLYVTTSKITYYRHRMQDFLNIART